MAQTVQIVPKFSFPYVETHINDYTEVYDTLAEQNREDPVVRYVFPFISSKGVDNVFVKMRTKADIINEYGNTAYTKYGTYSQALLQATNVAEAVNSEVYCMRVMPDDANYANLTIDVACNGDDNFTNDNIIKNNVFYIHFYTGKVENATTESGVLSNTRTLDKTIINNSGSESSKYNGTLMRVYSTGRGTYGNMYRIRITNAPTYQKEYGINFYNFEILSTETGVTKIANYIGTPVTSNKYSFATCINDVISDRDVGTYPIKIQINEDVVKAVYDKYIAWCNGYITALETYINNLNLIITDDSQVSPEQQAAQSQALAKVVVANTKLEQLKKAITTTIDEFDIFGGNNINNENSFITICIKHEVDGTAITNISDGSTKVNILISEDDTDAEMDTGNVYTDEQLAEFRTYHAHVGSIVRANKPDGTRYYQLTYDGTKYRWRRVGINNNAVQLDIPDGLSLFNGNDGTFTNLSDRLSDDSTIKLTADTCLINAFNGTYDKRILSANRIPVNAFFDACYPKDVKNAMVDLVLLRNDCLCYLDCGIMSSFTDSVVENMISEYSVFTDNKISKNIQHYYIKEPSTMKRIPVTITYFLARKYADHVINFGAHIPFVKNYARLEGHIKDSLYPTIDDYEMELKELLITNRFNYFETISDNVFQRACQNTSQSKNSDLLEENNITTLYNMKRIIERDITNNLYNFADADIRKDFKDYEMAKFASWVSRDVQSFDIDFRMNEWEADRSILHCYINVTFRGLMKRAILEIDINKRDNSALDSSAVTVDDSDSLVNYIV